MASITSFPTSWGVRSFLWLGVVSVTSAHAALNTFKLHDHLARRDASISLQARELHQLEAEQQHARLVRRGKGAGGPDSMENTESSHDSPYQLLPFLSHSFAGANLWFLCRDAQKNIGRNFMKPDGGSYTGPRAEKLYQLWARLLGINGLMNFEIVDNFRGANEQMESVLKLHHKSGGGRVEMVPHLQEKWDTSRQTALENMRDPSGDLQRAHEINAAINDMAKTLHSQGIEAAERLVKSDGGTSGGWDVWSPSSIRASITQLKQQYPEAWAKVKHAFPKDEHHERG